MPVSEFIDSDIVLIATPFSPIDRASLGLHILQSLAKKANLKLNILYSNINLAAKISEPHYKQLLNNAPLSFFIGERLFARAAHGTPPLGHDKGHNVIHELGKIRQSLSKAGLDPSRVQLDLNWLMQIEEIAFQWVNEFTEEIVDCGVKIVGCTTMFEQTNASIAILRSLKKKNQKLITCLGGANCEGEMAEGIKETCNEIDHIFSGESEYTFLKFLSDSNRETGSTIIHDGKPNLNMDEIATPYFKDYIEQLKLWLPDSELNKGKFLVPYESSRGCWWGEKSHCTFCGLNGNGMAFRSKSPDRVLKELKEITQETGMAPIAMTDNIMPMHYFKDLLPLIESQLPDLAVFYEEKANLTLENVTSLYRSGIREIQLGIESLSTEILKLMKKGSFASKNIAVLRYTRIHGISVQWNLLYGFPGESVEPYEEMISIIPYLYHLPPPTAAIPVLISRFSPYFDDPVKHHINNLRPLPAYFDFLPKNAPIDKIAYHFIADYETAVTKKPEIAMNLFISVHKWVKKWVDKSGLPKLEIQQINGNYNILDTRNTRISENINEEKALLLLFGAKLNQKERIQWALEKNYLLEIDGKFIPLATADYPTMKKLELLNKKA